MSAEIVVRSAAGAARRRVMPIGGVLPTDPGGRRERPGRPAGGYRAHGRAGRDRFAREITARAWTANPAVPITGADQPAATFTAPAPGAVAVNLQVPGSTWASRDQVTVSVVPVPPPDEAAVDRADSAPTAGNVGSAGAAHGRIERRWAPRPCRRRDGHHRGRTVPERCG